MLKLLLQALFSALRSRQALVLENAALRHQIDVLQRNCNRPGLRWRDRAFWDVLSCLWTDWRRSLYIVKPDWKPSQIWRSFLTNHAKDIVSIDFFTVPTATFRVLYVFLVLDNARRKIIHFNVTTNPTAIWTDQQIVEAFPWDTAPKYLIRDRDGIYGSRFTRRVTALGIKQIPTARRSPWQNPYVERVIGSIRRECLDHVIILNERHLRRVLRDYLDYYHRSRTHLGLEKDCPVSRPIELPESGDIHAEPVLGVLHHRYTRRAA